MPAWDSLSENSKRLFAHQMEVYAGYSENADHHVGRLLDAIEEMGELDNTVVVWIWGDNGASLEGTPTGSFNEGTMVNGLPLTDEEQMQLALKWGGLEAWGTEMMYPHYSTAWAWAGNTPFPWGKQVASHLGGTRDPLVIRWPAADHGRRRRAVAVHPRQRHRPDDPRRRRHPAADPRRRHRAAADDRLHLRRLPRPTPTPRSITPSSTSRTSATAPCTRTAGGCRCGCRASRGGSTPRC